MLTCKNHLRFFTIFYFLFIVFSICISCGKDVDLFEIISDEQIDESEQDSDSQSEEESSMQDGSDDSDDSDSDNGEEGEDENSDEGDNSGTGSDTQKLNIIFDTDANNELDDQHALAYLLSNGDLFNLEVITVNATGFGGGIQNDFDEATRILQFYNL
ncbi:hypothetical protein ACFSQJ_14925, partial [Croceitalea marina]